MKSIFAPFLVCLTLAGGAALPGFAADTSGPVLWPGRQPDGSMLLPNQWSLRPAGTNIALGDFPVNIAISPDGKFAAVLHCGYGKHEVLVVSLADETVVSRAKVDEAFFGLAFSHDGKKLFCSGASSEVVHAFDFKAGQLSATGIFQLRPPTEQGVPAGVAVDPKGRTLYVANLWNSRVSIVNLTDKTSHDLALTAVDKPVLTMPKKPVEDFDTAAATKRARAMELAKNETADLFPYACALDAKRDRLYLSLWGASTVAVLNLKTEQTIARWSVGPHPCELALRRDGKFLFVANANDNTVTVLDTQAGRAVATLWATLFPNSPLGATPNSLALSPDEKMLFIANANINAIAVFDVADPLHGNCLGFIPTGWYPTSVRVTPNGKQLLIANGKGLTALANPQGPQPVKGGGKDKSQYIAALLQGSLSIVELPSKSHFTQQLATWTAEVLKCTPLRPDASVVGARPENNPIPGKPGDLSPITHCIYIIKENRTYDQVFGDMKEGNGDSSLCLFPERVTPNLHKLARQFVLLDNCYADAEVSADGHEWSMAGYATDFVEKTWPLNYGHKTSKFPYPSEGVFPIAAPTSGYLWDKAREAGVSYRSYGEFVQNARTTNEPGTVKLKSLQGHFDPWFRSFDMNYPDSLRADRFISELHRFEQEGEMPRLQIVRMPNDHTHGVSAGKFTPSAYVAENDAAVGRLVEAVSQSKFWTNTAVFIIEDDAQNGPDHVDAHRTEALVISPYTKHGAVDSTLYSTTSLLRTMELILGLQPMTQFDAAATPMFNSFQTAADASPYLALPATVNLEEKNKLTAWGAQQKFNYVQEDANDDFKFNEVIWRSVKGNDHPMPAPMHAGFVMARGGKDSDD